MNVNEWLSGNILGIDIWRNKYQYNNESFEDWVTRISGGNSDIAKLI